MKQCTSRSLVGPKAFTSRGDGPGLRTHIADHLESPTPISEALLRCLNTAMAVDRSQCRVRADLLSMAVFNQT